MTPEQRLDRIEAILDKQTDQIEKQNEGIRGLIVVARTCLDSIQELRESQRESVKELRNAQVATDEKLNILIATVDRIIRHRNGKE